MPRGSSEEEIKGAYSLTDQALTLTPSGRALVPELGEQLATAVNTQLAAGTDPADDDTDDAKKYEQFAARQAGRYMKEYRELDQHPEYQPCETLRLYTQLLKCPDDNSSG